MNDKMSRSTMCPIKVEPFAIQMINMDSPFELVPPCVSKYPIDNMVSLVCVNSIFYF
jgi:hypothetical protein